VEERDQYGIEDTKGIIIFKVQFATKGYLKLDLKQDKFKKTLLDGGFL
jgi:hypothetical protein